MDANENLRNRRRKLMERWWKSVGRKRETQLETSGGQLQTQWNLWEEWRSQSKERKMPDKNQEKLEGA
jgi:hypothetical protein